MNLKTLPFLLLSLGMLSGCTNSCQGKQNPPAAEQQAPETEDTAQASAETAVADAEENSTGDVATAAE